MFGIMPWKKEKASRMSMPREVNPFRMFEDMDALFRPLWDRWPMPIAEALEVAKPWGLDVEETEKEIKIRAELPGFEAKEIEVILTGDLLTIRAKHPELTGKEVKPNVKGPYAAVERSITLPPGTDMERVEALYRNGVLEVHLPKTPESLGRRIEVKT